MFNFWRITLKCVVNLALILFLIKNGDGDLHHIKRRVVDGNFIDIAEVPWMVSVHNLALPKLETFICAGAIIGPNLILTAAHCFKYIYRADSDIIIRAGSSNPYLGNIHHVDTIETHPDYEYKGKIVKHDLALIRLEEFFEFNTLIHPIEIAHTNLKDGQTVEIAGWGNGNGNGKFKHEENAPVTNTLNSIKISAWKRKTCKKILHLNRDLPFQDDMRCLKNVENDTSKAVCYNDSGNPVVFNGKLVGIVSTFVCGLKRPQNRRGKDLTEEEKNAKCNDPKAAGMYNSVTPHYTRNWIYKELMESRRQSKRHRLHRIMFRL